MEMAETDADDKMETTAINADADKTSQKSEGEEHGENLTDELIKVKADENRHITPRRMLFYFVNFCFLFGA